MTDRVFVDSNVWVYAVDADEPIKQAKARAVLDPATSDTLATSAQVLGEFYFTITRKLARPVPEDIATSMVDRMAQLPVVSIDADGVQAAIAGSRSWRLSYWDALIIVAAQSAGCARLLTEDLTDGATYGGVRVENPFVEQHRVSETQPSYGATGDPWDDDDLLAQLSRYEEVCRAAGMRQNAIHSYWDYARRFLAWRVGDYQPRGTPAEGRRVPAGPVTQEQLAQQADAYAQAIEAAGREPSTVDTYHRHAMFFIRWLRGDFQPGSRLGLYHTPKEVAEILGISDDAVLDLVNRGDLPGLRISPRITRIPIAAFDRWREGYRPKRRRVVIRRARRQVTIGEGESLPVAPALSPR